MSTDSVYSNTSQFVNQHAESHYKQFYQHQHEDAVGTDKRLADLSHIARRLSDKTRKND